jgi:hypothetical protein
MPPADLGGVDPGEMGVGSEGCQLIYGAVDETLTAVLDFRSAQKRTGKRAESFVR